MLYRLVRAHIFHYEYVTNAFFKYNAKVAPSLLNDKIMGLKEKNVVYGQTRPKS